MKPDKQLVVLVAFCIAFLLLGFSAMYAGTFSEFAERHLELFLVTFLGAWAGGWAAFRAERSAQETDNRNAKWSAANKAVFQVSQAYEMLENLRRFYIDADNAASLGLHGKFGFARVGLLPGVAYRHGRWADTIMVQRSLASGSTTAP